MHQKKKIKSSLPSKYYYLVFFCMLYMAIMLFNIIFTNRYVELTDKYYVLGGTLTSPLVFILGDIITELYGYRVIRCIIFCGFFSQTLFSLMSSFIIHSNYPSFWTGANSFNFVFGPLVYLNFSSFVAFVISNLVNAKILIRLKVLMTGKYFSVRSFSSSTIAEALYSAIAIFMMQINHIQVSSILNIIILSYLIKAMYSLVLAYPGQFLVDFIKKSTGIDHDSRTPEMVV